MFLNQILEGFKLRGFLTFSTVSFTHLDVEAELLQAFEEGFFVAWHECLHVRVDV